MRYLGLRREIFVKNSSIEEFILKKILYLQDLFLFFGRDPLFTEVCRGPLQESNNIILLVNFYLQNLVFMTKYFKYPCHSFIAKEIYEGSFIFHVIYFI